MASALQALRQKWARLAPREQRGVRLAAALIAVAVLWGVLLAPALRVLQKAPAQLRALDAEQDTMLRLQQRARALQGQTAVSAAEALKGLQLSIVPLGSGATLRVLGDQATLTLQQVGAKEFAAWLAQPATALRAQPTEVHVQRDAADKPTWSGTLTFTLPQGGNARP